MESLLGIDGDGGFDVRFVPYAVALLLPVVATAAGTLPAHRALRDVAIRRGTA